MAGNKLEGDVVGFADGIAVTQQLESRTRLR